jgi:hypothetical protein
MTLDIIGAVIPFKTEFAVPLSRGNQRSNLLTPPPMLWREEHVWNVSVLHRVHLSNLVCCELMFLGMYVGFHFHL